LAASDIGNSVSQSKQIVNEMFFKNSGFQKICETADCYRRFALPSEPLSALMGILFVFNRDYSWFKNWGKVKSWKV
jgi:hypothetical protein